MIHLTPFSACSLTAPARNEDYDFNGNLLNLQAKPGEQVWNYSYDAQNRLTGGAKGPNGIGGTFTFSYDARNRCVARTINGITTLYIFDEWNFISDLSADNTELAKYIHGAQIDEILATLIPNGTQFTIYHHHHDSLGSITALTDADGNIAERYTYDIYGSPSFYDANGTLLTQSALGNRWLFTGREWVANASLYDYRNRFYSANLGRWLSRDPIVESGGLNLYEYCRENPARFVDPLGEDLTEMINDIVNVGQKKSRKGKKLADQSLKDAEKSGLPGLHNGAADAYRHCLWSCRMAKAFGEDDAKKIGDEHENAGDRNGQPSDERKMDEANNAAGRKCAKKKKKNCEDQCMDLLNGGGLSGPGGTPMSYP